MNFLKDFCFLRPSFLWLLPTFFIFYLFTKKYQKFSNIWETVCDKPLLSYLMQNKKDIFKKKFNFWVCFSFICAVIALAGPSFYKIKKPQIKSNEPLMIVLDLSSEMNRADGRLSRLNRAKIEITDILQKTNASPSGLIVYTYEPFLISPLSYDPSIIINLLSAVSTNIMPLDGNKLDRALDLAYSRLNDNGFSKANVLVLSADIPLDFASALSSATKAAESGIKTSVYGLSQNKNEKLEKLADAGQGVYSGAQYASSEKLIRFLKNTQNADLTQTQNFSLMPEDNGFFFAVAAAFCMLMLFKRGLLLLVSCFFFALNAQAGFFYTDNQEGALLFSSKEYDRAAQKFGNTDWKAAAYYRAKNYAKAVQTLQNKNDVTSLYNKANALAKWGKIAEAINTYEQVLSLYPNHDDARFNLEYLKKLSQNQSKQQQNTDDKKDNNNENQDNKAQQDQNQEQDENKADNQNNQNEDQNEDFENNQEQQQAAPDEQTNDEQEDKSEKKNEDQNEDKNGDKTEKNQMQDLSAKQQDAPDYDETVQAREQKFRLIKEDPGGLLKAFIQQEYLKKRYEN